MKSFVIISTDLVKRPDITFSVEHNLSYEEFRDIIQRVSPRFSVTTRRWRCIDSSDFCSLEEAIDKIKNAIITYIDPYNYEEVDTWHLVEDGIIDYPKFKTLGYYLKVCDGKTYYRKKEFQRVPLKYTYRNVADGSYKTIERI